MNRIIGTIVLLISGILIILDVLLEGADLSLGIENLHGFLYETNFITFFCQYLAFFLVILGGFLNPYLIGYASPIYSVSLSLYWVFSDSFGVTKNFFSLTALGMTVLFMLTIVLLRKYILIKTFQREIRNEKMKTLETFLDLFLTYKKQENFEQ
ncbi:hypothetical protein [Flavobacterium covae]|uniref:hypothetical protein n=1 Tax=Flavobacterium covae TaxID=2906076 RepID=UPI000F51685B|nr:hypothetical protein [Flavobacterium covae]